MIRAFQTVLLVALAGVGAACYDPARVEMTVDQPPPAPYSVKDNAVSVTEGTAVVVRIAVIDSDGYLVLPDSVDLTMDGDAATIAKTDLADIYAIGGAHPGNATLVVGSSVRIPVTVTPANLTP